MAQQVLKKMCEVGVGFSFAAVSVFRLRRAEAASAVWIPHWHSEPFESQGARAAKRWARGGTSAGGRCALAARRAVFCGGWLADFLAEGAGRGASPGPGGGPGCQAL